MFLRLVLYASLAWMAFGPSGAHTIAAKGCHIDPNGGTCPSGAAAGGSETVDRGGMIDPNGGS
ncbi:MAG TPA: hypothetical protein VN811_08060 [Thermoanaerobaculia bacterium]|nr:hypothetical protein [Thermoanaerobaculia bacterium]HXT50982.1 hypothetical protein [Thermoanaerobaculia bacterium]